MAAKQTTAENFERVPHRLAHLLLDASNPRFGGENGERQDQTDILDHIVEQFGIDDVLSSIAVNGFFEAEPLVGVKDKKKDTVTIVEGNRRLAACLIIAGDPRASRQAGRTASFSKIWVENGRKPIDPVPVILFHGDRSDPQILSYLGVRHISSSQPWDSYAKAAWVASIVEKHGISVQTISSMIGDTRNTIVRLLQGYYFVQNATETAGFSPSDSVRKGRGSVTEYPFSWVYTALGYSGTKKYLGLKEGIQKNPIAKGTEERARLFLRFMFGDRSKGINSAIADSRQLGDLAVALLDPEKVTLLERGRSLEEVIAMTQKLEDRIAKGLSVVREVQAGIVAAMTESPPDKSIGEKFHDRAAQNRRVASDIEKKLKASFASDDTE